MSALFLFLPLILIQFMRLLKIILLAILSVLTGALFIYSAYTKLYSLESFERFQYTIVEYVHLPWWLAVHCSRILTGMEGALGILIAAHLFGKSKWILSIAIWLLVAFSIYLVYLWAAVGNDINCGCFGDKIWMSPASSLVKNIIMIAVILVIKRYHTGFSFRWTRWAVPLVFLGFTFSTYAIFPLPATQPDWLKKDKYKIDLSALYAPGKADAPKTDLYKGKHVIAFFSLTCPHCKMAAYKMHVMKKKNPSLPFHIVYAGNSRHLDEFWKDTQAESMPHTRLQADDFTNIAGFSWPAIFLVNDGWVEGQTNYVSMSQAEIEKWLAAPSK